MASKKTPSQYQVTGLIINVGYSPTPSTVTRIVGKLRDDVPEFAAVVGKKVEAALIGKGAHDILVQVDLRRRPTIGQAWAAVHALVAHELVADSEPAVQVTAQQPTGARARGTGEGDKHLQCSDPPGWSVDQVGARTAWTQYGVSGKGVKVGHPDTGYTRHPEIFDARLLVAEGYNFEDGTDDPLDPLNGSGTGHGAATASVIMANTQRNPRVVGVAPAAKLVPLRVSDSVLHFNFSNLVQALYRARDKRCHLVSMSLGGPWGGRSLARAVDQVVADGLILLAAAGNVWPSVVYPALYDNVVAVAASNCQLKPWKSSASGKAVDITAPGESVWRAKTRRTGADKFPVERSSGTSYAVATTAGACALWLEHHGIAALQARYGGRLAAVFASLLKASCRPVPGWDTSHFGPGVLDAAKLLSLPLPSLGAAPQRSGMAQVRSSSGLQAIDRLHMYVPELTSRQLAKASFAMLGDLAKGRGQAKTAAANRPTLMDEVAFYVATDAKVRAAFIAAGGGGGRKATKAGVRKTTARAGSALERLASEPLRKLIKA